MRVGIIFLIVAFFCNCSIPARVNFLDEGLTEVPPTTIYLVRHAEKEKDGTRDPQLNAQGIKRSNSLAEMLKGENIRSIYSTDYQRTKMTGMPLARKMDKSIEIYSSEDEIVAILDTISENTLIIGHSNTIPRLINRLLGKEKLDDLKEDEYDKLFSLQKKGELYELTMESF